MDKSSREDDDPWHADDDVTRPRGMFTERDRRFLIGELDEELSDNAIAQKRYQIRERMVNAILDFVYFPDLRPEDIDLITEKIDDSSVVQTAVYYYLSYLWWILGSETFVNWVGEVLEERAFSHYVYNEDVLPKIDVTIEVPPPEDKIPLDEVYRRYKQGEELSEKAFEALELTGRISETERTEYSQKNPDE